MIQPEIHQQTTSVVVCTHLKERLSQLRECLDSIFAQTQKPDEVIVIVDGDLMLASQLTADLQNVIVRRLQRRSGVSAARNLGAQIASMDIIAFLDDDATAHPDWLRNLCQAFSDPNVIGVSGRSIPWWEVSCRPRWFPEEFYWTVGCSYKGMPSTPAIVRNVYGGCAAFRRADFLELRGFNPARGRHGGDMSGGEEAEFSMRASARWPSRHFKFEPSAIIFHRVPRSRSSVKYLVRRCLAEGKAKSSIIRRSVVNSDAGFSTESKFAASIPSAALHLFWKGLTGEPVSFLPLCGLIVASAASSVGVIMGLRKQDSRPDSVIEQCELPPLSSASYAQNYALNDASNSGGPAQSSQRTLRVLVVAARFLPDLGGIETHVNETARRLARREDIDLTVLATDRSGQLPAKESIDGLTVLRCRSYPRRKDYYIAPSIYGHIRDGDYELIHCQGIHTAVPVLAMLAARRRAIPYVVTLHTGGHSSDMRNRSRAIQWHALAPLLRGAATIVAVSRFEQQLFQQTCHLSASRLRVIQNGGNLSSKNQLPERIPGRIVSSGRLEKYKGHQRVIEALPIVRQTIPDATVHILGSGPYHSTLQKLTASLGMDEFVKIEYISPDNRVRMAESLREASVFAALSDYEAHPVAVMEALTLGLPVVGLDTAGIGDLVADGLVKGVAKSAPPAIIARALIAAMTSPCVKQPTQLPTWEAAAADLADVYWQAVENLGG